MVDPNALMFRADRTTWNQEKKTIDGQAVKLVATQISRRSKRKRTVHVYHIQDTNIIIFNRGLTRNFFMKIAFRPQNMKNFFDTFVNPPQTAEELIWLKRYDYVLV